MTSLDRPGDKLIVGRWGEITVRRGGEIDNDSYVFRNASPGLYCVASELLSCGLGRSLTRRL